MSVSSRGQIWPFLGQKMAKKWPKMAFSSWVFAGFHPRICFYMIISHFQQKKTDFEFYLLAYLTVGTMPDAGLNRIVYKQNKIIQIVKSSMAKQGRAGH